MTPTNMRSPSISEDSFFHPRKFLIYLLTLENSGLRQIKVICRHYIAKTGITSKQYLYNLEKTDFCRRRRFQNCHCIAGRLCFAHEVCLVSAPAQRRKVVISFKGGREGGRRYSRTNVRLLTMSFLHLHLRYTDRQTFSLFVSQSMTG